MPPKKAVIEAGMTAVVTGASSGIGEQFARQLAARGVHLVLVARNGSRLEALATELRIRHDTLHVSVSTADLADAAGTRELAVRLATDESVVDVLINNAGVGAHGHFVEENRDAVAREIQLNCGSLVALTREFLPGMVDRHRGGIINVASTAGFQPIPSMAVYAASKAFVLSFTEALWSEARPAGVRVMALCPGPTDTRFFETASPGKPFLTRGRQSSEHVADVALRSFDRTRHATVVPGVTNRLLASGYRFMPREAMLHIAEANVRAI